MTNDVSLIIFVPLTILLFGAAGKEKYILPVLTFQNIAAIRGSLLMPFGSPQNLFLYGQASVSAWHFMLHMLPLCVMSAALLIGFIFFLYRKDPREAIDVGTVEKPWTPEGKTRRIVYLVLFALIITVIVTRTPLWPWAVAVVIGAILLVDRKLLLQVDYVLIITFLCFFVFSSSIAAHPGISGVLTKAVAGNEYWWAIGLSQLISNVPATIVLYPFTENFAGLIYGVPPEVYLYFDHEIESINFDQRNIYLCDAQTGEPVYFLDYNGAYKSVRGGSIPDTGRKTRTGT